MYLVLWRGTFGHQRETFLGLRSWGVIAARRGLPLSASQKTFNGQSSGEATGGQVGNLCGIGKRGRFSGVWRVMVGLTLWGSVETLMVAGCDEKILGGTNRKTVGFYVGARGIRGG